MRWAIERFPGRTAVLASMQKTSSLLLHALDRGVTFFDTAALYGFGANETLVGEVLAFKDKLAHGKAMISIDLLKFLLDHLRAMPITAAYRFAIGPVPAGGMFRIREKIEDAATRANIALWRVGEPARVGMNGWVIALD